MTYNALDVRSKIEEAVTALQLEISDIQSGMSYDDATLTCDDCPHVDREPQSYNELEFGVHYASSCCRDDGTRDEENRPTWEYVRRLELLIKQLNAYLTEVEK